MTTKLPFYYVRCKHHPKPPLQFWGYGTSSIYCKCCACGVVTGAGLKVSALEHFDLFQFVLKRQRGESIEEVYARADAIANASTAELNKYKVDQWTEPSELLGKRPIPAKINSRY